MKKNRMMRLASLILVLTLLSTCAISGTFAKYVTTGSAQDSARVAKWGVTVGATGNEAFSTMYKDKATAEVTAATVVTSSAEGADGKKLVAPGTEGDLGSFGISGTPEVATIVAYSATLTLSGWEVPAPTEDNEEATAYYCPIEITVGETTYKGNDYENAEAFAAAVVEDLNKTEDKAANESVAASNSVTWKWAFEGNDDVKDTALGDAAAAGKAATIAFSISASVTQVD